MENGSLSGLLLDLDHRLNSANESEIRLFVRTKKGIEVFYDRRLKPYFYIICDSPEAVKKRVLEKEFGEKKEKVLAAREVKKENAENVLKLEFKSTEALSAARQEIKQVEGVLEKKEHDMHFTKRYLVDNALEPMNWVEIEYKGKESGEKEIIGAKTPKQAKAIPKICAAALDIETYSPGAFPDPAKNPVVMASVVLNESDNIVITTKNSKEKKLKVVESEKALIEEIKKELKERAIDVLATYNGDSFDLPYLKERAKVLGTKFDIGFGETEPVIRRKGLHNSVKIKALQHVDAYQVIRILSSIGSIDLVRYDLETVYEAIFGEKKEKLSKKDLETIWETGKGFERLVEYNRMDSIATIKIALEYLPLYLELCKLVRMPLDDVSRISTGMLVEHLLEIQSHEKKYLIPNKPSESEVKERRTYTFKGAFVKEPLAGLHENIAIVDFRSYHTSIMIAHNISVETIDCECCAKEKPNLSPTGHYFCSKKKGFLAAALEEILAKRMEIKKEMESVEQGTAQCKALFAVQWALKILLASFYGYLGYPRSRWYSREIVKSVYAWVNKYIFFTMDEAEKAGFKVLYADTDSCFLIVPKEKGTEELKKFIKKINSELPEAMELELKGLYERGIFVTKKEGGAAKKRYALIDKKGNLSIVGFEYVRRDWAGIAKQTQKEVIEAILKEGNPEKAKKIVRKKIELLKSGKAKKQELVIYTQIQRPLQSYESVGPHIAAAVKAQKKGLELGVGSIVGYIITKAGKSISEKAELEEFVQEGNYDAEYYINNQLVPAVIRIMQELGYSEQDLIQGGKQEKLGSWGM